MASMNTERLYSMCACVSMDDNSGTNQKSECFFFATLYKAVSKFMIPAICQCEWPGAVEEHQTKHISCGFAKIHQRLCPHFKHTVRSVSFYLVLGSQPCMISPITNQQASPWSHLIVRFVTADTLNVNLQGGLRLTRKLSSLCVFCQMAGMKNWPRNTHEDRNFDFRRTVLRRTDSPSSSSNRTASEFPTLINPKRPGSFKSLRLKQWRDPDCQQARSQVFGLRSVYSAHISFTRCQHASPQHYGTSSPTFLRENAYEILRGKLSPFRLSRHQLLAWTSQPTPSFHCGPPCCFHICREPGKRLNKTLSLFTKCPHNAINVLTLRVCVCKHSELCEFCGIFTHRVASSFFVAVAGHGVSCQKVLVGCKTDHHVRERAGAKRNPSSSSDFIAEWIKKKNNNNKEKNANMLTRLTASSLSCSAVQAACQCRSHQRKLQRTTSSN